MLVCLTIKSNSILCKFYTLYEDFNLLKYSKSCLLMEGINLPNDLVKSSTSTTTLSATKSSSFKSPKI